MNVKIFNVAFYILNKMGKMTTMKLQKLVYYCQAWSLAWDEKPLFDERIEAWANGPVSPELFDKHRGKFVVDKEDFSEYSDDVFTAEQKETMDKVIEYYGDKEPLWLSNLTHQENPWKLARANLSMQEYYGGI